MCACTILNVYSSSQWESVPVGSEDVTEAADFWLVTGEPSRAACSSSSTSASSSLRERERRF